MWKQNKGNSAGVLAAKMSVNIVEDLFEKCMKKGGINWKSKKLHGA